MPPPAETDGPAGTDGAADAEPARETLDRLAQQFARGEEWFASSPLYRVLSRTVAADPALLQLAALARPGQQPTNMLMAALHLVVLRDPELPFARFFASVAGAEAGPPEAAGAELPRFCAEHREELAQILRRRLVQTNEPGRATAIRLALHELAMRTSEDVTFLEIGPSAGIQLRFDRWGIETGGRRFGPNPVPLTVTTEWRSDAGPPDLDAMPRIRHRLGIDLHPVDARDPEERLWLEALVWPEHRDRLVQLRRALDTVAEDPPKLVEGDAIELLPVLDEQLPEDIPLVVFHAMVRMHVAAERRGAFDAAIAALAERRRLFHISLELPPAGSGGRFHLLTLRDSEGVARDLAVAEGHGRWIQPTR